MIPFALVILAGFALAAHSIWKRRRKSIEANTRAPRTIASGHGAIAYAQDNASTADVPPFLRANGPLIKVQR